MACHYRQGRTGRVAPSLSLDVVARQLLRRAGLLINLRQGKTRRVASLSLDFVAKLLNHYRGLPFEDMYITTFMKYCQTLLKH